MAEIKYRQRTDEELEDMKRDLMTKGNIIAPCILSDADTCYSNCPKFYDCWRDDYSSKLEDSKLEKESICDSINKAKEKIKSWPDWKKSFVALENDNTFTKIDLEKKSRNYD